MLRTIALVVGSFVVAGVAVAQTDDALLSQLYGSGVHEFNSRDYVAAHTQLTAAIKGGTQDPRAYYFRGLCYLNLGREQEALADFQKGAELEAADSAYVFPVDRSLERIQGRARQVLEQQRTTARVVASQRLETARQARYEQRVEAEKEVLRHVESTELLPTPSEPAAAQGAAARDDPFAEPKPKPAERNNPALPAGDAAVPAPHADVTMPAPAEADPFAPAPQPAAAEQPKPAPASVAPPAPSDKPAPAETDPFGAPAAAPAPTAPDADPFAPAPAATAPAGGQPAPAAGGNDPFAPAPAPTEPAPTVPPGEQPKPSETPAPSEPAPAAGANDPFAPAAGPPVPAPTGPAPEAQPQPAPTPPPSNPPPDNAPPTSPPAAEAPATNPPDTTPPATNPPPAEQPDPFGDLPTSPQPAPDSGK